MKEKCVTLSTDGYRSPPSCAPHLLQNQLTGAVDLTHLPASLENLWLCSNQLTGSVDLTQLPTTLVALVLHCNKLTGAVDLTKLPTSLTTLSLYHNAGLTGEWRGDKPIGFCFDFTGITVADA
jgi:hypothetical protein